jgi:hypothetical protein
MEELANFPQELKDILQQHATTLEPDVRMVRCHFVRFHFCMSSFIAELVPSSYFTPQQRLDASNVSP